MELGGNLKLLQDIKRCAVISLVFEAFWTSPKVCQDPNYQKVAAST